LLEGVGCIGGAVWSWLLLFSSLLKITVGFIPVEIPTVVQHSDLPAVLALKRPQQLIAKPLRHAASPFPYVAWMYFYHMGQEPEACRSQGKKKVLYRISFIILIPLLKLSLERTDLSQKRNKRVGGFLNGGEGMLQLVDILQTV
jgi:hypothetical protein